MSETPGPAEKARYPRTFWTADTVERFERAAYYSMASFMVIYLAQGYCAVSARCLPASP